jgi:hypothetical protein
MNQACLHPDPLAGGDIAPRRCNDREKPGSKRFISLAFAADLHVLYSYHDLIPVDSRG